MDSNLTTLRDKQVKKAATQKRNPTDRYFTTFMSDVLLTYCIRKDMRCYRSTCSLQHDIRQMISGNT